MERLYLSASCLRIGRHWVRREEPGCNAYARHRCGWLVKLAKPECFVNTRYRTSGSSGLSTSKCLKSLADHFPLRVSGCVSRVEIRGLRCLPTREGFIPITNLYGRKGLQLCRGSAVKMNKICAAHYSCVLRGQASHQVDE